MSRVTGTASVPTDDAPKMRASDADRHATARILQDAIARGLLNPGEGSDRMAAAFAVVYRQDLPPITADLPTSSVSTLRPGGQTWLMALVLQLQSLLRDENAQHRRRAQLAAALLILLVVMTCGLFAAHVLLGQGAGPRGDQFGRH